MSAPTQRLAFLAFAVVALAATAIWALRVASLENEAQRLLVPESTMWGMHACFVVIAAGLAASARPLYQLLGRRRALTALGIAVGGHFVCYLAPQTNRIFFDEHIYMQIGQTIAHTGRAEGANYARVEYGKFEMYDAWVNKQPNGLPYLLSWIYRLVGVSDSSSHFLNRALTGLTAAAIYLSLALAPWALPAGAALAAALLFLFTPLIPWWGHTVAVEPASAASVAFAFLAACAHARLRDRNSAQGLPTTALLLAGATGFAVYFRPESMLVFPLVALVLWSTDDRFIEDLSAWAALALSIALAAPNTMHLWSMRTESWGATDGRRFDLDFVQENFKSNGGYFIDGEWFPFAGTVLAVLGLVWLLRRNRTALVAIGLWFAMAWGIFVLYYAGGYHYGASSRYGLISCAPVALFMGIGAAALFRRLRTRPAWLGALAAAGLINWVAAMDYVPTLTREAIEAQDDSDFVKAMAKILPSGALVISPDPCMWNLQGINSSQYFVLENMLHTEMRELASQYPGGIYQHWSFWHNAEPEMARYTAEYLAQVDAVPFHRVTSQAFKLGLYRLDTPTAFEKFGGRAPEDTRADRDLDTVLAKARARLESEAPAESAP